MWWVRLLWPSYPNGFNIFYFSCICGTLQYEKLSGSSWPYLNLDGETFMVWLASSHLSQPGLKLWILLATPHSTLLVRYVEYGTYIPSLVVFWIEAQFTVQGSLRRNHGVFAEKLNNLVMHSCSPPQRNLSPKQSLWFSCSGWCWAEIKCSVKCICNGTVNGCHETNL